MVNIWLVLFIVWGLPLTIYRSRFRKIVYRTDSWWINVRPVFWKEIKGLLGNLYPGDKKYLKFRNFYRFYLLVYMLLFTIYLVFNNDNQIYKSTDMDTLKIGDTIPGFSLYDQHGNLFHLDTILGRKNLVIFFYPKDDSPGCTKEACYFQDQFEIFRDYDAEIIGISGQSIESHKKFADRYNLSYTLLSDKGNKLRKKFGVPANLFGLLPGRVTYIIDKQGIVVYTFNSQTQAERHVDEALKILKDLK